MRLIRAEVIFNKTKFIFNAKHLPTNIFDFFYSSPFVSKNAIYFFSKIKSNSKIEWKWIVISYEKSKFIYAALKQKKNSKYFSSNWNSIKILLREKKKLQISNLSYCIWRKKKTKWRNTISKTRAMTMATLLSHEIRNDWNYTNKQKYKEF